MRANQRTNESLAKQMLGMNQTKYGSQTKLSGSMLTNPPSQTNARDTSSQTNLTKLSPNLKPKESLKSQTKLQGKQ